MAEDFILPAYDDEVNDIPFQEVVSSFEDTPFFTFRKDDSLFIRFRAGKKLSLESVGGLRASEIRPINGLQVRPAGTVSANQLPLHLLRSRVRG